MYKIFVVTACPPWTGACIVLQPHRGFATARVLDERYEAERHKPVAAGRILASEWFSKFGSLVRVS